MRRVLAVQGQDPRGFRLAVRARTTGRHRGGRRRSAHGTRSLVVSWLNRGTLHLVTADDFWWLHDLTTPQLATESLRRLGQEGVSPELAERGVATVVEQVSEGPRTREELRAALDAAGVPTTGQALVHVLLAATLRHRLIRGPVRDGEHCMVLAEDWLGPAPEPLERDVALARLARRYLEGHGPASDRDLAMWAKLPLRDARAGLAAIETVDAGDGLVDLPERAEPGAAADATARQLRPDPARLGVAGAGARACTSPTSWSAGSSAPGRSPAAARSGSGASRAAGCTSRPFAPLPTRTERALLRGRGRRCSPTWGCPRRPPSSTERTGPPPGDAVAGAAPRCSGLPRSLPFGHGGSGRAGAAHPGAEAVPAGREPPGARGAARDHRGRRAVRVQLQRRARGPAAARRADRGRGAARLRGRAGVRRGRLRQRRRDAVPLHRGGSGRDRRAAELRGARADEHGHRGPARQHGVGALRLPGAVRGRGRGRVDARARRHGAGHPSR